MQLTREERRRIATEFVESVNAVTVCAHCGAQPVEWHREDHVDYPNARVSSLRTQGSSVQRIQKEISLCMPLCRLCHMKEDGRLATLRASQPNQPGISIVPKLPCSCCGVLAKPLRRSMCTGCYNHHAGIRPRRTASCDGCCDSGGESPK